jgi:hypothetical protein
LPTGFDSPPIPHDEGDSGIVVAACSRFEKSEPNAEELNEQIEFAEKALVVTLDHAGRLRRNASLDSLGASESFLLSLHAFARDVDYTEDASKIRRRRIPQRVKVCESKTI